MSRGRWLAWVSLSLVALAAGVGLACMLLIPSNDELAMRLASRAQAALGVPVSIGSVRWQLLPPAVVIDAASTDQPQPIRLQRLVAQPDLRALFHRELRFDHVLITGGVMPQLSLGGLHMQALARGADAPKPTVGQLRFHNLTWITRYGTRLEFDGNLFFDADGMPREGEVVRAGAQPATRLALARQGQADRWRLQIRLGGGSADGEVALKQAESGKLELSGQLEPRNVEVSSAMAAFKRHSVVQGKASGRTVLTASGEGVAQLARTLHTRTSFTMAPATLLHIDVDKAIRSLGKDHAGQTPLASLAGQMDTQNTPSGMVVRYSGLQARGETFSASGGGTIANRQIDGEVKVDIVGGLIGVPLKVAGPLHAPHVSVQGSALAAAATGAAIGTAVLPGVGTAVGAGVGAALGKLFGGHKKN